MSETTYYVWRRSDGHTDWTTFPPQNEGSWTFSILLSTTNEQEARERLGAERAATS
jgi:hypothetical protein